MIGKQIGSDATIDSTFLSSVVWVLLLATTFRYFQWVVLINRQYKYVHQLEDVLSYHYNGLVFTREGRWYLDRYPGFANWADVIYRALFPTVIILVATAKILTDIVPVWPGWGACCVNPYLVFNAGIYLVLLLSVALYVEIFQLGRTLRLALVTIWALVRRREVDEAVRTEMIEQDGRSPSSPGSNAPDRGPDQA
ncbi:MAG: hypothetical protein ACR2PL_02360 [Dehalococcoidia bacterium]